MSKPFVLLRLRRLIGEAIRSVDIENEMLESGGWWPVDGRALQWAHAEHTEAEPVPRTAAIKLQWQIDDRGELPWKEEGEWSDVG